MKRGFFDGYKLLLAIAMLFGAVNAHAGKPLRDPTKLWEAVREEVYRVNARVVFADYVLIRQDFPEVGHATNAEIDAWLVRNAAIMSKAQVAQEETNTKINTTGETRMAYRPREYGRGHVVEADTGGLLDVKGSGSLNPRRVFERTGLATLAELIREYLFEKLVSKVFQKIHKYETVPCYAVLALDFDVKGGGSAGQDVPAALVVRRAHVRAHDEVIGERTHEDPTVLPNHLQLEIEMSLRRFGLTSAIDVHPGLYSVSQKGDQLNIQGTEDGAIIDFAGYHVRESFHLPIYYTYDKHGNANVSDADIAMQTNDPRFIQPDPAVAIPTHLWGNSFRADLDNVYLWSEGLAYNFAHGQATQADAQQHYLNFFEAVDAKLNPPGMQCHRVLLPL